MPQGAPASKRTNRTDAEPPDLDLDLDAWLAKRGLDREKRMKVGGKWFRFLRAATAAQITAFGTAREKGDLFDAMAVLLVDPGELDELKAAFDVQRQPIDSEGEKEYLVAIINFLVAGDVGESSAS